MLNLESTITFESIRYPGAVFKLRKMSWSDREAVLKIRRELRAESMPEDTTEMVLKVMEVNGRIWKALIVTSNVQLDGIDLSVEDQYHKLPEDLVEEVLERLDEMITPLGRTNDADEALIENIQGQIKEANKKIERAKVRIAERKNSKPPSSVPVMDGDGTVLIVNTEPPETSEKSETAPEILKSGEPSNSSEKASPVNTD